MAPSLASWLLLFSRYVRSNSVTPRTVVCQPPLSVGFPGKHTGVGCHFLLPAIFPTTQGLNACQLHRQTDSVPEGPGKPRRPPHSVTTPSSWARAGPLTVSLCHQSWARAGLLTASLRRPSGATVFCGSLVSGIVSPLAAPSSARLGAAARPANVLKCPCLCGVGFRRDGHLRHWGTVYP